MSNEGNENGEDSITHQLGVKRTQGDLDGPASKKPHIEGEENFGSDQLSIKILIPSAAVGAIIGKGGESMRALKTDNQCRVQMSKSSDTYPGTSERVCLVKGRLQNVMCVVEAIMDKIREKCDGVTGSDAFDHKAVNRGNEIKIVMPNTSAGMVIGKSGANIKDIRESYGIQIQVFPKAGSPEAKNSLERVVSLAHEDNAQLLQATARVLEKVAADPHHSSEINKEDFGGKGAFGSNPNSSFSSSAGFATSAPASTYGGATPTAQSYQSYGYSQNNNAASKFQYNPMNGLGNNELLSFLDNLQNTLRTSGFNETSVAEVMQAMQVLAKYNIMGLGLGLGVAAMAQMRTQEQPSGLPSNHGAAGFGDQGGYQTDASLSFDSILLEVKSKRSGAMPNGENFASSIIVERRVDDEYFELEVPDTMVGAVLGPKAKTLQEIQQHSGCKVQVHKRDAKPGLPIGSRLISLSGDEDNVRTCRFMIERVINEAQDRRPLPPRP